MSVVGRARRVGRRAVEVFWREPGEPNTVLWSFVVNTVIASGIWPARVRTQLYVLMGLDIDRRAFIKPGATFRSSRVRLGRGAYVGYGVLFDVREGLVVGDHVGIGSHVIFADTDHHMDDPARRAGPSFRQPIEVGDGARVSTRSTVLRGVTIGRGAVVGAGSIVTADCEEDGLYVGAPARLLRTLPTDPVSA